MLRDPVAGLKSTLIGNEFEKGLMMQALRGHVAPRTGAAMALGLSLHSHLSRRGLIWVWQQKKHMALCDDINGCSSKCFGNLNVQVKFKEFHFLDGFIAESIILPRFPDSKTPFLMFQETNSWHASSSFFLILSRNLAFHFCLPPFDTYQHFDNFAVRSLSGDYDVPPGEMTTQHLEKAKGGAAIWRRGGWDLSHQLDGVSPFFSFWTGNPMKLRIV